MLGSLWSLSELQLALEGVRSELRLELEGVWPEVQLGLEGTWLEVPSGLAMMYVRVLDAVLGIDVQLFVAFGFATSFSTARMIHYADSRIQGQVLIELSGEWIRTRLMPPLPCGPWLIYLRRRSLRETVGSENETFLSLSIVGCYSVSEPGQRAQAFFNTASETSHQKLSHEIKNH